jgi:RNA polymerase sigma-70 factor (ECF subfamily)
VPPEETDLIAATGGDEAAFARLIEPRRRELRAHCYRMCGSLDDAEDLLQETFIRAWKGLASFEQRSSFRTWLYKVATNVCLNALEARKSRTLPSELGPPVAVFEGTGTRVLDPTWLEPLPDALLPEAPPPPDARIGERDSVCIAFLVALQRLPAKQRAVLLLRDVLGFEANECAELLEISVPAVKSALQRARETLDAETESPWDHRVDVKDPGTRDLLARYVAAWERADVDALVAVLREDATFSMPPMTEWFLGPRSIGRLIREQIFTTKGRGGVRVVETRANGAPAFAIYFRGKEDEPYVPKSIQVLALEGDKVARIINFHVSFLGEAKVVARFGLPERL